MCVDLRKVNSVIKHDVYPLPNINDALSALQGALFFCSLDMNSGYWQIPIKKEDREKTAFITQDGLYEFNYMPFGITTAPSFFQRTMDVVLAGLKWNSCMVYIDDIIVFAKNFNELLERLEKVLIRMREADLTLKPEKCSFGLRKIKFLGHVVDSDGIKMDPDKIEAVRNFKIPNNLTGIRSFLGLAGY